MAAFHCSGCKRDFDAEEARCPKCLRKSTVRARSRELSEADALASSEGSPSERPGLYLGLIGLSLVLSLGLLGMYASSFRTLTLLRAEWPAAIGLLLGSVVSLRFAPRAAIDDPRPLLAYARWIGLAALVGSSVMIAGLFATWMLADVSIVLTILFGVVLWLAAAVPAFSYGLRALTAREGAIEPRPPGKWR